MKTNLEPVSHAEMWQMSIPGFAAYASCPSNPIETLNRRIADAAEISDAARSVQEAKVKQALAEIAVLKAEALNRAKSDLLADMSHEIRTPLSAIIGIANILLATKLDDKQKQCVTVLQASAEDLMTIINCSLDIDKIESKMINLEHAPFSMPPLLHRIASVMSVKAQEKGIDLTLNCGADLHIPFVGDSGRIRQIVMNLVGNAIKFTEAGKVIISFEVGDGENGKKDVAISVADTGIGIPEDKLGVIFNRFIQVDSSIACKFGGTGLGLSISKALAESMGGTISVRSAPGKGSIFVLRLQLPLNSESNGERHNKIAHTEPLSLCSVKIAHKF